MSFFKPNYGMAINLSRTFLDNIRKYESDTFSHFLTVALSDKNNFSRQLTIVAEKSHTFHDNCTSVSLVFFRTDRLHRHHFLIRSYNLSKLIEIFAHHHTPFDIPCLFALGLCQTQYHAYLFNFTEYLRQI